MELNGTIYVAPGDSIPEVLQGLFALAEDPREVQVQVGSREILVSNRLLDAWTATREGEGAETTVSEPEREPDETTAPPAKRRPRKAAAPAAEENA